MQDADDYQKPYVWYSTISNSELWRPLEFSPSNVITVVATEACVRYKNHRESIPPRHRSSQCNSCGQVAVAVCSPFAVRLSQLHAFVPTHSSLVPLHRWWSGSTIMVGLLWAPRRSLTATERLPGKCKPLSGNDRLVTPTVGCWCS